MIYVIFIDAAEEAEGIVEVGVVERARSTLDVYTFWV